MPHPTSRDGGRILVGVDGSALSSRALDWAARQAVLTRWSIVVLMAWEWAPTYAMHPYDAPPEEIRWQCEEDLDAQLAGLPADVKVTSKVLQGRPADLLLAAAREADLLVVGSSGLGAARALLLGSVSRHLVRHARIPVVVAHEHDHPLADLRSDHRARGHEHLLVNAFMIDDRPWALDLRAVCHLRSRLPADEGGLREGRRRSEGMTMATSTPRPGGSDDPVRIQQEAARVSVTHRGPTADRYESALERYVGAVAGEHAHPAGTPNAFPPRTVADVMTRAVVSAYEKALFKEVASSLARNRISGVPVINEDRHVVGCDHDLRPARSPGRHHAAGRPAAIASPGRRTSASGTR